MAVPSRAEPYPGPATAEAFRSKGSIVASATLPGEIPETSRRPKGLVEVLGV